MILTGIQARNYQILRFIDQPLAEFHALVGANASGKPTSLDVFALRSWKTGKPRFGSLFASGILG